MNLLFSYPIIVPMSSDIGIDDIRIEVVWAILIVCNVIGLITLLITYIINKSRNKRQNGEKEGLFETMNDLFPLFFGIGLAAFMDLFFLFIGSILFVSTLL